MERTLGGVAWQHYPAIRARCWPFDPTSNFDPERECEHRPGTTYTRQPCSCGRELWPPRGRGRGESLLSPRRIAAKLRTIEAMQLHGQGYSYKQIAQKLGYADHSGPAHAVQRIRDQEAAWYRWQEEQRQDGQRRYRQGEGMPTPAEAARILAALDEELRTGGLDGQRLADAKRRLRALLVDKGRRSARKAAKAKTSP